MLVSAEVVSNIPIAPLHYHLTLSLEERIKDPHPGQFAMIKVTGGYDPLLMRPLSIYDYMRGPEKDLLEFVYQVRGKGTRFLSELDKGRKVRLMVPLGKGFTIHNEAQRVVLIAGGLGIVPISFLAKSWYSRKEKELEIICYFGVKSATSVIGLEKLRNACDKVRIFTEDGSLGKKGLVIDGIREDIGKLANLGTFFYACGPKDMLIALAHVVLPKGIPCEISLEERMACGVGACLGCVVPIRTQVSYTYKSVCREGPVFPLHEVVLVRD
ncbi:MAG: dihydroorotate dehydrogenase electron transfer subunit [Syntrophales bacterium]|nr:dihydroorotate dehydrogenase electron transfer subunit [Syntrophales bacterium]